MIYLFLGILFVLLLVLLGVKVYKTQERKRDSEGVRWKHAKRVERRMHVRVAIGVIFTGLLFGTVIILGTLLLIQL